MPTTYTIHWLNECKQVNCLLLAIRNHWQWCHSHMGVRQSTGFKHDKCRKKSPEKIADLMSFWILGFQIQGPIPYFSWHSPPGARKAQQWSSILMIQSHTSTFQIKIQSNHTFYSLSCQQKYLLVAGHQPFTTLL